MTYVGSYKQRCHECDSKYTAAGAFCPFCGTPRETDFQIGVGAVLYEDRPDTPDDERRLHHVTDRRVSLETGDVYYVIWDGTHTTRYHYHAEDVFSDFTPAGWCWPTSRKPTYWLTRQYGVDDRMDLMTDGGSVSSTGGIERNSGKWIGPGTWLVDRRHYRPRIGVVTDIRERDRDTAARLSIRWRNDIYQNISVTMALDHFISGDWRVDDA